MKKAWLFIQVVFLKIFLGMRAGLLVGQKELISKIKMANAGK